MSWEQVLREPSHLDRRFLLSELYTCQSSSFSHAVGQHMRCESREGSQLFSADRPKWREASWPLSPFVVMISKASQVRMTRLQHGMIFIAAQN
jgi:hypothetical protein